MAFLSVEVGFVGVSFLLMLIYFPAKPDLPPTASASVPRLDFKTGIKELTRFDISIHDAKSLVGLKWKNYLLCVIDKRFYSSL